MAELVPRVLVMNAAGATVGRRIAVALSVPLEGRRNRTEADSYFDNALDHVRDLFAAGHPIVAVAAAGILIRAVAPLLADKSTEPPVIAVTPDGDVVPLLGGHRGGNRLASRVARALGGRAAISTAGEAALGLALDDPPPGWRLSTPSNARAAMAALLSGGGATVIGEAPWLADVPAGPEVSIWATPKPVTGIGDADLVFHPQVVTVGVGCARDCPPEELCALVDASLSAADIAPGAVASVNTLALKADEPAVLALAARLGAPLRLFDAPVLDALTDQVTTPSSVVFAEVGTHSVAEAAALAGGASKLLAAKRKSAMATCALGVAEAPIIHPPGRPRGRVSLVGIGPGRSDWRTPEASRAIADADELVGYGFYIDLLGPAALGKTRADFPLGGETDRCRYALEAAGEGRNVALICSGDAGIYAMGALVFELLDKDAGLSDAARRAEVLTTPGISALQAAAARSGAPLGHDFCAISLSDLLTPRADIVRRLTAAADGDFVIAFYNPVSARRRTLLAEARTILLARRPPDTPVLLARSLGRPDERLDFRTLDTLSVDEVDMMTVVLVGASQSRLAERGDGPVFYTPRGYAAKTQKEAS